VAWDVSPEVLKVVRWDRRVGPKLSYGKWTSWCKKCFLEEVCATSTFSRAPDSVLVYWGGTLSPCQIPQKMGGTESETDLDSTRCCKEFTAITATLWLRFRFRLRFRHSNSGIRTRVRYAATITVDVTCRTFNIPPRRHTAPQPLDDRHQLFIELDVPALFYRDIAGHQVVPDCPDFQ
jgi:hypothetical protein